jgi:hypothetical protein
VAREIAAVVQRSAPAEVDGGGDRSTVAGSTDIDHLGMARPHSTVCR